VGLSSQGMIRPRRVLRMRVFGMAGAPITLAPFRRALRCRAERRVADGFPRYLGDLGSSQPQWISPGLKGKPRRSGARLRFLLPAYNAR
jgi:hypothetical protein